MQNMMRTPSTIALAAMVSLFAASLTACGREEPGQSDEDMGWSVEDQDMQTTPGDMTQDMEEGGEDASMDMEGEDDMAPPPDMPPAEDMGALDMAPGCEVGAPGSPLEVATTYGLYKGTEEGGVISHLGMPYAAPPVGELRWRPPAPPECAREVQAATDFGASCMQVDAQGEVIGSEDCLTINVWSPSGAQAAGDLKPVMFFIHGGGNVQGSSSQLVGGDNALYDGRFLVERRDVVVVTFNYRLGPFGFLALDEFAAESEHGSAGNYGLLDQIAALEWVQENISAFGGDPERVMIFGESAGAVDTCMMLATPLASGLFHRALMQSGGCLTDSAADAHALGSDLVDLTPCEPEQGEERASCMRALDAREIHETIPGVIPLAVGPGGGEVRGEYGPNVDGWVLTEEPLALFKSGGHNKVPVIIGSNAEEMESFLAPDEITQQQYEQAVFGLFAQYGAGVPEDALALYLSETYGTPRKALEQMLTDAVFTCPAGRVLEALSQGQQDALYRYFFTKQAITRQGDLPARHGIELLYIFYTLTQIPFFTPDPSDTALAERMMDYWGSFATSGVPVDEGGVAWPEWSPGEDRYLELGDPVVSQQSLRPEKCAFWDPLDL